MHNSHTQKVIEFALGGCDLVEMEAVAASFGISVQELLQRAVDHRAASVFVLPVRPAPQVLHFPVRPAPPCCAGAVPADDCASSN